MPKSALAEKVVPLSTRRAPFAKRVQEALQADREIQRALQRALREEEKRKNPEKYHALLDRRSHRGSFEYQDMMHVMRDGELWGNRIQEAVWCYLWRASLPQSPRQIEEALRSAGLFSHADPKRLRKNIWTALYKGKTSRGRFKKVDTLSWTVELHKPRGV